MTDLPILTSEDDWLELNSNDRAVLRGRIGGDHHSGSTSILIYFNDWSANVATITDEKGLDRYLLNRDMYDVMVTRTEDGLETTSADITPCE